MYLSKTEAYLRSKGLSLVRFIVLIDLVSHHWLLYIGALVLLSSTPLWILVVVPQLPEQLQPWVWRHPSKVPLLWTSTCGKRSVQTNCAVEMFFLLKLRKCFCICLLYHFIMLPISTRVFICFDQVISKYKCS